MNRQERTLSTRALDVLASHGKIEAIKIIREETGLGLKEAKELVEAYIDSDPALAARMNATQARNAKSFYGWFVIIVALAALAWWFVSGH